MIHITAWSCSIPLAPVLQKQSYFVTHCGLGRQGGNWRIKGPTLAVTPLLPDPIHLLSDGCNDLVLSVSSNIMTYEIRAPNMTEACLYREILVLTGFEDKQTEWSSLRFGVFGVLRTRVWVFSA